MAPGNESVGTRYPRPACCRRVTRWRESAARIGLAYSTVGREVRDQLEQQRSIAAMSLQACATERFKAGEPLERHGGGKRGCRKSTRKKSTAHRQEVAVGPMVTAVRAGVARCARCTQRTSCQARFDEGVLRLRSAVAMGAAKA
jgi:hypothetical protein